MEDWLYSITEQLKETFKKVFVNVSLHLTYTSPISRRVYWKTQSSIFTSWSVFAVLSREAVVRELGLIWRSLLKQVKMSDHYRSFSKMAIFTWKTWIAGIHNVILFLAHGVRFWKNYIPFISLAPLLSSFKMFFAWPSPQRRSQLSFSAKLG